MSKGKYKPLPQPKTKEEAERIERLRKAIREKKQLVYEQNAGLAERVKTLRSNLAKLRKTLRKAYKFSSVSLKDETQRCVDDITDILDSQDERYRDIRMFRIYERHILATVAGDTLEETDTDYERDKMISDFEFDLVECEEIWQRRGQYLLDELQQLVAPSSQPGE